MAIVIGTTLSDFIHRLGDGFTGPGNEVTGVTTGADQITADVGNDLIFADGGNDTINADDGNDTVVGGQGADRQFGGVGNDVFRIIQQSDISGLAETVNGGNDIDTLDFLTFAAIGAIDLTAATIVSVETLLVQGNDVTLTSAQLDSFLTVGGTGFIERMILSDGGLVDLTGATMFNIDEIRGNALVNQINLTGVGTGQLVNTLAGDDSVAGSLGADRIDGGTGNDSILGADGADAIFGGDDVDTILGGIGNDTISGGNGADVLSGDVGNDVFRITLVGEVSGLAETIDGGSDVDTLDFQSDQANGSANISSVVLTSVETLLLGGTELTLKSAQLGAFSTIIGTGFPERLILSNSGTADLTGATIINIDEIRGSGGADMVILSGVAQAQFVDGQGGADTIEGTAAADTIKGGNASDVLSGNEGNDVIRGEQGADNLDGGIGNDVFQFVGVSDISGLAETIDGGNDVDMLDFQTFGAFGRVDLSAATLLNVEILNIVNNQATLTAAQLGAFETITGSGQYERIQIAAAGIVDLTGTTIINIDEFRGTSGADTFLFAGASGNMTINAQGGADLVSGGDGSEIMLGAAGNDTLIGGAGGDLLVGQNGTDSLTGGAGVDTFAFDDLSEVGTGAARDVITDFTHGQDILRLTLIDADLNNPGDQQFTFIGGTAFGAVAGQLRYSGGVISGDVDGDGAGDFQIALSGSPVLTGSDIQL